jgi:DNA-3-methyladenine glycosylase I
LHPEKSEKFSFFARFAHGEAMKNRCGWATSDPLYIEYHDQEWGVPVYDDQKLFEFLILEGAQAGLSWITILRKRENFRKAFDRFNPQKIAKYDQKKVKELMTNAGIIRNQLKIQAAIENAKFFLQIQKEFGSFQKYLWQFVDGLPIQNSWSTLKEIPARTPESDEMSKDLKKKGFKFVGSTICYAQMQACGLVNDHLKSCFRYRQILKSHP